MPALRVCAAQERSGALSLASENLARAQALTEEVLAEFDLARSLESRLNAPVGDDLATYLADVDRLLDVAASFEEKAGAMRAAEPALRSAQELLSRAMARCEEKLKALLSAHARDDSALECGAEPPKGGLAPAVGEAALPALLLLVEHMDAVSYAWQRSLVSVRARALEAALGRQGLGKLQASEVGRAPAEALAERALLWARLLRWLAAHAAPERGLAARLLASPSDGAVASFVCGPPLEQLLAWGEALVRAPAQAERLFALLDVHCGARAQGALLAAALAGGPASALLARLAALAQSAGDAARAAFQDMEASVGREERRGAGPDGTVHPLTAAAVLALRRLFEQPRLFDLLCGTQPPPQAARPRGRGRRAAEGEGSPDASAAGADVSSSAACSEEALEEAGATALRVIVALHTQLEARARGVRVAGLGELFLLNNLGYVCAALRQAPLLRAALGDEWLERQEALVTAHGEAALEAVWGAAAAEVRDTRGLQPSSLSAKERERVKDKFRLFNEALEAAAGSLPHWSVPDEALRDELKRSLQQSVLHPYTALYNAFPAQTFTKFPDKYVKATPEEAERIFQSFFEGMQ